MASSGWQSEREVGRTGSSAQYAVIGNIRVDSITHTGNSLRVSGMVCLGIRGTSGGYAYWVNGARVDAGNGGTYIVNPNEYIYVNQDHYVSFDITVSVPADQTQWDMPVNFKLCQNAACSSTYWDTTEYWRLSFDYGGGEPSGPFIENLSSTWNTVTGTFGLADDAGRGCTVELKVLKEPYVGGVPARQCSAEGPGAHVGTVTNYGPTANDPDWVIKGCGFYYTGVWAYTDVKTIRYQGPTIYTPPAPSVISYVDLGGYDGRDYSINFTGVLDNNESGYSVVDLTRTVRYKIDNSDWVYVAQDTPRLIQSNTTFNITIPAGKSAVVEGWQTYKGLQSEVTTVTIKNSNAPVWFYGSVDSLSDKTIKFYGPVESANNPAELVSKKVIKIYGSKDGVSRRVYEDV